MTTIKNPNPDPFQTRSSDYELRLGVDLYRRFQKIWGDEFSNPNTDLETWADIWYFIPLQFTEEQLAHGLQRCAELLEYSPCPAVLIKACKGLYDSHEYDPGNKFGLDYMRKNKDGIISRL